MAQLMGRCRFVEASSAEGPIAKAAERIQVDDGGCAMTLIENFFNAWERMTCSHHWVRARWEDGTYGLRCAECMRPYRRTWDELLTPPADTGARASGERRAA